jgi:hypothetical protein
MYDSQKKSNSNRHKLQQERIEKVNPRHTLAAEEQRRLNAESYAMSRYS